VLRSVVAALLLFATYAAAQTPVVVRATPLISSGPCTDSFVRHPLDHTTRAYDAEITFYDSNGAGLAAGDLDDDGDVDLVFATLRGRNAILWNRGGMRFEREELPLGDARAVQLVDVDDDGRLDIVFTQNLGALTWWRNLGGAFARTPLPGVTFPAYAMAWADLDGDGDLDLVTASYDTLLEKELRDSFLFSERAGVVVYRREGGGFTAERLSESAQALALALYDVDGDGRDDLVVGNDFEIPDAVFLAAEGGWRAASPFATTTRNTMSFAAGDVDNDGVPELFATDMRPAPDDEAALVAWEPLMAMMADHGEGDGVQIEENVLYRRGDVGFSNLAAALGVEATGWSWSGSFGDLDSDGRLDLYVVNGMIAHEILSHLPGAELVERNRAFRGTEGAFVAADGWGLDARESGRGMVMADLDGDGDLDVVVNNLESPALLFENRLCGGSALAVELRWPGGGNGRALGATVWLRTDQGLLTRRVQSGSGYLSGDAAPLHFGLPDGARFERLEIVWPDGAVSRVAGVEAGVRYLITRPGDP
jgi:hypothetical protein